MKEIHQRELLKGFIKLREDVTQLGHEYSRAIGGATPLKKIGIVYRPIINLEIAFKKEITLLQRKIKKEAKAPGLLLPKKLPKLEKTGPK